MTERPRFHARTHCNRGAFVLTALNVEGNRATLVYATLVYLLSLRAEGYYQLLAGSIPTKLVIKGEVQSNGLAAVLAWQPC